MRYEDASGAFQATGPVANDDQDTLSAGQKSATGNLITGEGTQYGAAGADSAAAGHITSIAGKGGEDTSFAGGKLSVSGEHGQLSVDAEGNYTYLVNKGAPENVRDRFVYTLADNQGNTDTAALIVEIGKTPAVVKADAQQIVPGPDGVVTLPPGVELSDIMVVGRNLVVNMPDGTQLIIVDGAVFVPQLQLGGVEVPATNVAALLIGQEPQPAAGELPPSSGGNFALPPPPLDPGVPLGDLIPPTEYDYTPPEPQEVDDIVDEEPEIFIQPDGQPAAVNAVDAVDEAGLPARPVDEPEGSGEEAAAGADGDPSEATSGTIIIDSPDGVDSVTINGVLVTGVVGQEIEGQFGTLTITGFSGDNILYSYVLNDNTSGDATHDDFSVTLTDSDGDQATATLVIDIIDDVPTARPDTDALGLGETIATGNVITDASPGDAGDSDTNAADTVGADDASLTSVSGAGGSDSTFEGGVLVVNGQYGVLTIDADGNYTYVKNENAPGGVTDVFNYTITDGDGDTSSSTLTITIPDNFPNLDNPPAVLLDDDALANGNPGGTGDDVDSQGTPGQLMGTGGDGDLDYNFTGVNTLPAGFTANLVNASTLQILQGGTVVLTITLDNETGAFSVVQNAPIDHPAGGDENNLQFSIGVEVEDSDGDTDAAAITINVDDDTPVAIGEGSIRGQVDEDALADGNNDSAAGDDPGGTTASGAAGDLLSLFSFGADQPGSVSLSADTSGLPALTSNGVPVTYSVVGNVLTASAGGTDVFTLTVNADGSWEFELLDQLDHPVTGTEDNLLLDFSSIIVGEDADGDTAGLPDDSFVIDVDDDMPAPADEPNPVTGQVDEDALSDGNNDSAAGDDPGGTTASGGSGSLLSLFNIGADQPGSVVLLTDTSGLPALTSNGVPVTYAVVGNVLTASAGGTDVFTLTVNADGSWEFELLDQLDHPVADTEDNLLLDLSSVIVAEDADGDPATAPEGSFVINVDDDLPVAANDTDTVGAPGTTATGNVITDAAPGDMGDGDNGADSAGADQPGTITDLASNNEPGNSDTDPDPDVFEIQGEFGVLVMNADGSYTYTRDPGTPGGAVDVFTYTLTDADGDSTTATLTITLGDATPVLPDPALVQLDDDDVGSDGNPGGTGDDDPSGLPGQLMGSGGDGDLDYNFTGVDNLPLGFSTNLVDDSTLQILQGATVVLTITLDNETGAFNVVQNNPIDHLALEGTGEDDTENNYEFEIGVEVEDSDGDVEPATITINVDDDTPVALEGQVTGQVDEDALADGNNDSAAGDDPGGTTDSGGAGDLFSLFSFGADQPGTVSLSTNTSGLPALTSNGVPVTYAVVGNVLTASAGGTDVFTLTVNADGSWEFELLDQLDHPVTGTEDNLLLDFSSLIVGEDADGDEVTALEGSFVIDVDDDLPVPADDPNPVTGEVDEDALADGNNDSATGDDPGGTTASGGAGDLLSLFSIGADQPGTIVLLTDTSGLPALTSNGVPVTYAVVGNVLTASAGGTDVFTLTVDADGSWEFELLDQLDHPVVDTEDNLLLDFSSVIGAEDADGDPADSLPEGSFVIDVDDDMPAITVFDPTLDIDNDASPSGTGDFVFGVGADQNSDNDDISVSNFTVQVNGVDATNIVFNEGIENATTASYSFSFDYDTGTGGTATAEGTLVFDKVAGTYTVELTSGPIEGFSLLSTGAADASDFVEYQVPDGGSGSAEVTVAQLDTDFFVQFSGVAEPGSGTGSNNLTTTTGAGGAFVPVTTASFAGLELFTQEIATIQVSNTAAGVSGNTIQGGEVLDLNLYATDPMGTLGGIPTQSSTSMFMTLDGIGGAEDMIVVLKLYDTSTGQYTTKAIIVQNADILTDADAASLVGTAYEGLGAALDNNDGLIVIEANDYQEGNTNLVIVGAQIAGSDEGITGTGINLNGDVGGTGGSSGTQNFNTDVSDAPFKITSIGFLTTTTEDQSATIDFDVTVTDADGDSQTESITVNIGDPVSPMPLPLAAESEQSSDSSSFSLLASDSQEQQVQKSAANSNALTLATAVAAAGLADKAAAHGNSHDGHGQNSDMVNAYAPETVEKFSIGDDGDSSAVSLLAPDASAEQSAPADSSSSSSADSSSTSNSLDNSPAPAADDSSSPASSGDEAPAQAAADASPVAPSVAMVSAEAMKAMAGVDGDGQQASSVEQVVAEALAQGNAPDLDAVLANLPGGNGQLQALAHMASPAADAVSGWDMAGQGAGGGAHEMMMSMHAANMHHDAVQPAVNG